MRVEERASELKSFQLSQTAWSCAQLSLKDSPLFSSISAASLRRCNDFNSQELSNMAWACAKRGVLDAPLFQAIASESLRKMGHFNSYDLSSTVWAYAQCAWPDEPLLAAISAASIRQIFDFRAQCLGNTAWSFAACSCSDGPLLAAISSAAIAHITDGGAAKGGRAFAGQELAQMAWAFATRSVRDVPLMASIASSAIRSIADFAAQSLSNMAWSIATLKVCDIPLLDALSAASIPRIDQFSVQELSNTSWANSTCGVRHYGPLIAALSAASIAKIGEFASQGLTNTAWAYAPLNVRDLPLLSSISAASIARIEAFNTQEVANTAWAYALLGVNDLPLMHSLAASSIPMIDQFDLRGLANIAWAGATLMFAHSPLLSAISAASLPQIVALAEGGALERPAVSVLALVYSLAQLDALEAPTVEAARDALGRLAAAREHASGAASAHGQQRNGPEAALSTAEAAGAPRVLRQAGGLCILLKPPGWTVTVGNEEDGEEDGGEAVGPSTWQKIASEKAMQDWLAGEFGRSCPIVHDKGSSCGLLHRLDKQTSGALLWAQDYHSYYEARLQFACRHVLKEYVCLCAGSFSPQLRLLQEPLQEWTEGQQVADRTVCSPFGRPALTEIRSVGHLTSPGGSSISLVRIRIHSGRRHQIRAHLTGEGHPLLGDSTYGGPCPLWNGRMFLHARQFGITLLDGPLAVEVPLPDDLRASLVPLSAVDGPARANALKMLGMGAV